MSPAWVKLTRHRQSTERLDGGDEEQHIVEYVSLQVNAAGHEETLDLARKLWRRSLWGLSVACSCRFLRWKITSNIIAIIQCATKAELFRDVDDLPLGDECAGHDRA